VGFSACAVLFLSAWTWLSLHIHPYLLSRKAKESPRRYKLLQALTFSKVFETSAFSKVFEASAIYFVQPLAFVAILNVQPVPVLKLRRLPEPELRPKPPTQFIAHLLSLH